MGIQYTLDLIKRWKGDEWNQLKTYTLVIYLTIHLCGLSQFLIFGPCLKTEIDLDGYDGTYLQFQPLKRVR